MSVVGEVGVEVGGVDGVGVEVGGEDGVNVKGGVDGVGEEVGGVDGVDVEVDAEIDIVVAGEGGEVWSASVEVAETDGMEVDKTVVGIGVEVCGIDMKVDGMDVEEVLEVAVDVEASGGLVGELMYN